MVVELHGIRNSSNANGMQTWSNESISAKYLLLIIYALEAGVGSQVVAHLL